MNRQFDVLVIGAGAAGLMCAARVAQQSKVSHWRVGLLDHHAKLAEKIRISGGGRCNFTNLSVGPSHYVSENPDFSAFALKHYTPQHFIQLVKQYRIPFHEKHKGQLFCDRSSEDIINMLADECNAANVQWLRPHSVHHVRPNDQGQYQLDTTAGPLTSQRVVIATGGLPVPQIGASDFGLRLAKQFGLRLVEQRPALVPLLFNTTALSQFSALSGISLPVWSHGGSAESPWFQDDLLFTHKGLSGPAILQASSYWQPNAPLFINWTGQQQSAQTCMQSLLQAAQGSKSSVENWLGHLMPHWPKRMLQAWFEQVEFGELSKRKVAELGKKQLQPLAESMARWPLVPTGTAGYKKAEVMRGGVSTDELNPRSMQAHKAPGLYFIGEVVDVTGWLGGYNFQWAWSSANVAASAILNENA